MSIIDAILDVWYWIPIRYNLYRINREIRNQRRFIQRNELKIEKYFRRMTDASWSRATIVIYPAIKTLRDINERGRLRVLDLEMLRDRIKNAYHSTIR